jgi:hypothetical protein
MQDPNSEKSDFLSQAATKRTGFVRDFASFLKQNKKWWLLPIIIAILGLGVLVILGGTGVAPFIYTLF